MIVTDEAALRIKCEDVKPEEVDELVATLEKELQASADRGNPGIGLAAPQIGLAKKIAIVRVGEHAINLVNAKIEKSFDLTEFTGEGCLSFPGKTVKTKRYQEVHIVNDVEPRRFIATGILAVVCQHELDHTRGVLLPDVEIKEVPVVKKKTRPNDPCWCGSSKKFKKCHGA